MSSMYHKSMVYRRFQRRNQARRKQKIALSVFPDTTGGDFWNKPSILGKLNKGKIHCSCCLCAAKTGRYFHKSSNRKSNWCAADRRKLDKLYYEEDYIA